MFSPLYGTDNNGVPILSKSEIDIIAEQFIKEFCPSALKEPKAIDIDLFSMDYLKLEEDFQYLSHCGVYLGMMVFNDTNKIPVYNPDNNRAEYAAAKKGTIIIDNTLLEEDQERRYRFTMAHECGHWIFHRNKFMYNPNQISLFEQPKQAVFKCRTVSLEGKAKPYTEWNDNDRMEWQANYTSSALLMPRSMILKMYNCSLLKQSREKNRNIGILSQQLFVARISNLFNVSNQAAEIRLKNLGIIKQSNISTFNEEYDKQFYGI